MAAPDLETVALSGVALAGSVRIEPVKIDSGFSGV
jgi:hypothetical protein